jgi:hypothetical protein
MFDEGLVFVERESEREKGGWGDILTSPSGWVSCEFTLLARYLLQSCHQENSPAYARLVVRASIR